MHACMQRGGREGNDDKGESIDRSTPPVGRCSQSSPTDRPMTPSMRSFDRPNNAPLTHPEEHVVRGGDEPRLAHDELGAAHGQVAHLEGLDHRLVGVGRWHGVGWVEGGSGGVGLWWGLNDVVLVVVKGVIWIGFVRSGLKFGRMLG